LHHTNVSDGYRVHLNTVFFAILSTHVTGVSYKQQRWRQVNRS